MSAWGMLKQGKIGDAAKRAIVWLLPAWLRDLVLKLWSDLWDMAITASTIYAEAVLTGQMTIEQAAAKLAQDLAKQSLIISRQDDRTERANKCLTNSSNSRLKRWVAT